MSEYLGKLNKVLFNIKEELSLDAVSSFLKVEDFEEFFDSIGYNWSWCCSFDDSTNENAEDIDNIQQIFDLLMTEINDEDNCIYSDKHCLVFELGEKGKLTYGEMLEFYISPYIFYHKSNAYTISLDGKTTFHDVDYSKKWISFLLSKYGERYADAVRKQFKLGFEITNKKDEDDKKQLESIYNIIKNYENLNF